ncbi:hypothetical protein D6D24_05255 [Aureobasidium pullulans]|uniref:Uncharacterized protein n=1 Tax=Aureobasidium pullulans TaxID=5580 RepID=A0A4S8VSD3_AURPU|nr:hypothetical protein D6D24_05255 [Aureobasidium pullulans]
MLSVPGDSKYFSKAQHDDQLGATISERSIELSVWSEDDKKALVSSTPRKPWTPLTLKAYFLIPTILASGALIVVLQIYLDRSNRDSGIIFAPNIDDLSLDRKFPYLYLPTIVSLVLSFIWTWLDLDVRRLQPFIELSKEEGARGDDSLLLHYPFDFVAFVPFTSAKRRHWPVFSASLAVVIIFWGLTPLQSSIFATKTVEKSIEVATARSTSYLSLQEQKNNLTGSYAQSVYNIAWLNETLPPFMSRQGMLAPFGLLNESGATESSETWTAPTTFYSVDINCESPTYNDDEEIFSTNGCEYDLGDMGLPRKIADNQFSSQYVGYWYEETMDSYLAGNCPQSANQTFLIRWAQGQIRKPGLDPTAESKYAKENATLWCSSSYYYQEVNATVASPGMKVLEVVPTGPKKALPIDFFNVTDFEWSMSQGYEANVNRGPYPAGGYASGGWPSVYDRLLAKFPQLYWDTYSYLPNMATFALAAYQRPMDDYLDPETLKDSYQAAYRLLFARRLVDVLFSNLDNSTIAVGSRQYSTQTVMMVPVFVYVVEGMVGLTAVAASVVLLLSFWTKIKLTFEPASLASLMALSGRDPRIIQRMSRDDCATSKDLSVTYQETRFALSKAESSQGPNIYCTEPYDYSQHASKSPRTLAASKLVLPMELSWAFGLGFLCLQIAVVVALLYIYLRVRAENGLSLPSNSLFVNQLLENYLPMVIGAFFEPVFTMLTRTLCMLQPYEQLRRGHEKSERSITLDYASLPPQAVVFRAFKNKHFPLALVSLMTLLANVLSVAISGLFTESIVMIPNPANFTSGYQFPLDGSSLGNESLSRNRPAYDQYYMATSNLTNGTPLPAWTDGGFFYMPFDVFGLLQGNITQHKAITPAVKASLHCFPMQQQMNGSNLTWTTFDEKTSCDLSSVPIFYNEQSDEPKAIEYVNFTVPGYGWYENSDGYARNCNLRVMAGWGRSTSVAGNGPLKATWVGCMPQLSVELREVTVDLEGHILASSLSNFTSGDPERFFKQNSTGLIESIHRVLDPDSISGFYTMKPTWHTDSYPSDFVNYLMEHTMNSTTFLDPRLPSPSFEQTAPLLDSIYSKLVAILLATNVEKILRPSNETSVIAGVSLAPETRIFVQEEMLIVSVAILTLYMLVTIALYVRRPWRILPRMPTTLASQIAFFAASHALEDLAETSSMSEKERNSHVKGLRQRYGFGRFVGTDGKTHIGIEREPLVQVLTKQDLQTMQKGVTMG